MLKSRVEWLRDERKAETELCELQEIFFETKPKEILDKLNEKKFKLLDFLQFTLEIKIEDNSLIIDGEEKILGKIREKVATLSSVPSGDLQLPNSLRFLTTAVLVGDLIQLDTRKNKSPFHLRQVATEDGKVLLQWVCTQDIEVLDQRNKDIQLVQLSQTVHDMYLKADKQTTEVVKTNETKEMENEVDENDVTLNDGDISKY